MQVELSTLKNNNARLTSALQESTSNVEEWKRQLHNYKVCHIREKNTLLTNVSLSGGECSPEDEPDGSRGWARKL